MSTTQETSDPATPQTVVSDLKSTGKEADSTASSAPTATEDELSPKRGLRFWLVYVALCISLLLAALDLASVATAAPTIVSDLHGEDFSWVASAYSLSSAACLPFSGKLAQIFGRRATMLGALTVFAAGSAVSGSATSMSVLIVGRAIQGVGGGGIQSLSSIVTADLVPLRERGFFTAITGIIFTISSIIGPFIAGGFAQHASWRWLFYMNLPLCAIAMIVVFFFLQLKAPQTSLRHKLFKLDWFGNALIVASTTASILGLTWGGVKYPWSSAKVLAPLVLGVVGLGGAVVYEIKWAKEPTIPLVILSNRTSISGYIATFLHGLVTITAGCTPTWFQAVRLADPIKSGVDFLPMSVTISPSAIAQGLLVAKLGKYKGINFAGWSMMLIGMGLFTTMRVSTPIGVLAVYQIIQGIGMGLLYCTYFPVMAPLPLSSNASAVALVTFLRAFSQAWGVAISGTILQNNLRTRLPPSVLSQYSSTAELAYAVIPDIPKMEAGVRRETQVAFEESLRVVWVVMVCLCGVGMGSVGLMREFSLRKTTDGRWGLKEREKSGGGGGGSGSTGGDVEAATGSNSGELGEKDGESGQSQSQGSLITQSESKMEGKNEDGDGDEVVEIVGLSSILRENSSPEGENDEHRHHLPRGSEVAGS
ncbi:major facilitator superfamily domain-containing protein [Irpex rosettiformis]|uniref:Major facilitator superfamily domain-containing protein n=1 Tax=Irpex rosettiformis TaxID=378272 RepID=A0ACB8TQR7_9APHY|nr:major facilitator superfamily domain-containing protein [Irpex rosettiformis]